jgi:hypothetical protein
MPIITICSSVSFYKQVIAVQAQLQALGYEVLIPATANKMRDSGDFEVSHYKTWFGNADNYHKKTTLMRGHFDEVVKADAVLVLNYEKHGASNYIGGNVLMEMALAFHSKIPIYLLNEIPEESSFLEEIIGLGAIPLYGDLSALKI